MNCSRFKSQLKSRIEERALPGTPDEALREHLTNCTDPACREAWFDACLLEQAIGEWAADFPKPDLSERVLGELQSSAGASAAPASPVRVSRAAPARTGQPNSSRWVVVSVALLVLVSLVVILSPPRRQTTQDDFRVADTAVAPPAPEVSITPPDTPERLADETELSTTYLSFAEDATQFLTDAVALTLAGEEEIEDPTAAADWIRRMEDRLGPLGEDFDAALDEFLQTIPDSDT